MFTMVASSTTISWARAMKASAFQRLGSGTLGALRAVSDIGVPLRNWQRNFGTRKSGQDYER